MLKQQTRQVAFLVLQCDWVLDLNQSDCGNLGERRHKAHWYCPSRCMFIMVVVGRIGQKNFLLPLGNALRYSIMKLNKNLNKKKLNKTNKTHIYDYMFTLFMNGSKLRSRRKNICHIPHKCSKKYHLSKKKTPEFLSKSESSLIGYLIKSCINQLQQSMNE